MTVLEFVTQFPFDELVPYIKKYCEDRSKSVYNRHSEYGEVFRYREIYDRIQVMKIDETHKGEIIDPLLIDEIDDWESDLIKTIEIRSPIPCVLWERLEEIAVKILVFKFGVPNIINIFLILDNLDKPTRRYDFLFENLNRYGKGLIRLENSMEDRQNRRLNLLSYKIAQKRGPGYYLQLALLYTKTRELYSPKLPTRLNGPKRKRRNRQTKKLLYWKQMLVRQTIYDYLHQEGSMAKEDLYFIFKMKDIKIEQFHAVKPEEPLQYVYQSITKYSTIAFENKQHAIVYIEQPLDWNISKQEYDRFENQMINLIGYEDIRFGYLITDELPKVFSKVQRDYNEWFGEKIISRTELDVTLILYNLEETGR